MLENGTGLSVTDVVPDDSYIVELVETSESHWSGAAYRTMVIVMKGDFYENSEKVAEMEAYFAWLEEREYIAGIVGMLVSVHIDVYNFERLTTLCLGVTADSVFHLFLLFFTNPLLFTPEWALVQEL